ncbi:MAG: 5-bromo-4-chloroindolyl phosphate hydrolysis family protein [Neomegalonema sp.]|nr:5-bromo-4-chloroindolyl phosphate hydrolysis family protein [Neomegalonema sp.]
MAENNGRNGEDPKKPEKKPKDDWRALTGFNRGERIEGKQPKIYQQRMIWAILGGTGVTIIMMLIGIPGWVSAIIGVMTLFVVMATQMPGEDKIAQGSGAALKPLSPEVEAALAQAEADLTVIDQTAEGFRDPALRREASGMTQNARTVLTLIRKDPDDILRAKKFLKVYIPSARRAVEKFAAFEVHDPELDARFANLLEEMRGVCARQVESLTLDERTDLEVEIEVLADRLKQES